MSTSDQRDFSNIQRFLHRSSGMRYYAPAIAKAPGNALCDCYVDSVTGRSYCVCSAMISSDIAFGPDKISGMVRPSIRFASPCERAAFARRRALIAKSLA